MRPGPGLGQYKYLKHRQKVGEQDGRPKAHFFKVGGPGGEPNTTGASGAATTRPRLTLRAPFASPASRSFGHGP
jgi:hypothetical protein